MVVELGAGTAIPSVRRFGESLGLSLVRINPDASEVNDSTSVSLADGALTALRDLDGRMVRQT